MDWKHRRDIWDGPHGLTPCWRENADSSGLPSLHHHEESLSNKGTLLGIIAVDYALLGGFITWLGGHLWLNSFLLYLWAPNTLPPSSDSLRSGLQMDIITLKSLMPPTCHPGCHSPWPILSMCEGMEWVRATGPPSPGPRPGAR